MPRSAIPATSPPRRCATRWLAVIWDARPDAASTRTEGGGTRGPDWCDGLRQAADQADTDRAGTEPLAAARPAPRRRERAVRDRRRSGTGDTAGGLPDGHLPDASAQADVGMVVARP